MNLLSLKIHVLEKLVYIKTLILNSEQGTFLFCSVRNGCLVGDYVTVTAICRGSHQKTQNSSKFRHSYITNYRIEAQKGYTICLKLTQFNQWHSQNYASLSSTPVIMLNNSALYSYTFGRLTDYSACIHFQLAQFYFLSF